MSETPNILDTILAHKQSEVAKRRARISLAEIKDRAMNTPGPRDFLAALLRPKRGRIGLIAEVKKASPSAGVIRPDFDPVQIARIYEESAADCLSVLTDERFFQGHDNYLRAIRQSVALPLLRKEFIVDEWQIHESRALGADAILLIVAALSADQIRDYLALATELSMAALVEVHTGAEMQVALQAQATLIGINSRDLKRFVTDLSIVERLAAMAPPSATLVAESGIKTPADVAQVANSGAKAILVGETLMRAPDIGDAIRALVP